MHTTISTRNQGFKQPEPRTARGSKFTETCSGSAPRSKVDKVSFSSVS